MAQLSSIIGSILRDIISAQHEANLYSISLSENYGRDGKTKDFQLPNVVLSDMEMELKYGVVATEDNREEHNIRFSKYREFIRQLCSEASKVAIASVISTVLNSEIRRNDDDKRFFLRLKQEPDLYRKFNDFIVRNLRITFNNGLSETIDKQTGTVITEKLVAKMSEVLQKKFLNDSDLDVLFSDTDGRTLKAEAENNLRTALEEVVRKESEGKNFRKTKSFPHLDVAITADELGKMPEDAIHSFKLKFSPGTCNLTTWEEESDLEDFTMNQ